MFCSKCGKQAEEGCRFCIDCGNPLEMQKPAEKKSGSCRGWKIGMIAGATVLLVVLVVLAGFFCRSGESVTGPMVTATNAVQNTFQQRNFTAEISVNQGDQRIDGIAYVDIDAEREILHLLMEVKVKNLNVTLAVYDEYLILSSFGFYQCVDISEKLDEFFDTYEELSSAEPDLEDILDDISIFAYDEIAKYIDSHKLNQCMKAYARQLNNPRWLEKNAGYSTRIENGVEMYILEPDMAVFLSASAPYFQDALKNPEDFTKIMEIWEKNGKLSDKMDMYAAFGVKDGYLISIESATAIDSKQTGIKVCFSDIGTTELDPDELKDMLEKAQKMPW